MFRKLLTILFVGVSLFAPVSDQKTPHEDRKEISDFRSDTHEDTKTMVNITPSAPQLLLNRLEK